MHVLLTPDRFTGADTSRLVGAALAAGWLRGAPHDTVDLCPLSDGGPGFARLLAEVGGWPQPAPDGVLVVGGTAYVDSAVALAAAPQDGSFAVAAQLLRAVESGATRIVVGLGAPADVAALPDAGAGLLVALGLLGAEDHGAGESSAAAGRSLLGDVDAADLTGLAGVLERFRGIDLVAATATDIPLLGLHGASAGAADAGWASREAAQQREREIGQLADVLWRARERALAGAETGGRVGALLPLATTAPANAGTSAAGGAATGRARDLTALPGAGAGGGLGFALALLGARLLPGAEVYAQAVGLSARAQAADLVVAARGDLDGASFHGSGIEQAAQAASGFGVACVALAERSMMNRRELAAVGLSASYLLDAAGAGESSAGTVESSASTVADRAGAVAERVARSWSPSWSSSPSAPGSPSTSG